MSQPYEYHFEWDPEKARTNKLKHGIAFEQSASVFLDASALTKFDTKHGDNEDRWITLGLDREGRLVVVCHTFKALDSSRALVRIISARKATKGEAAQYAKAIEYEG